VSLDEVPPTGLGAARGVNATVSHPPGPSGLRAGTPSRNGGDARAVPFDYLIGSVHFVGTDGKVCRRRRFSRSGSSAGCTNCLTATSAPGSRLASPPRTTLVAWAGSGPGSHGSHQMWNKDEQYFEGALVPRGRRADAAGMRPNGIVVELNASGWRHAVRALLPAVDRQARALGMFYDRHDRRARPARVKVPCGGRGAAVTSGARPGGLR
jgi:hypothetical protein